MTFARFKYALVGAALIGCFGNTSHADSLESYKYENTTITCRGRLDKVSAANERIDDSGGFEFSFTPVEGELTRSLKGAIAQKNGVVPEELKDIYVGAGLVIDDQAITPVRIGLKVSDPKSSFAHTTEGIGGGRAPMFNTNAKYLSKDSNVIHDIYIHCELNKM